MEHCFIESKCSMWNMENNSKKRFSCSTWNITTKRKEDVPCGTSILYMKELIKKTTNQVIKDFALDITIKEELTEEALLQLIADQVAYYMEYDLEYLFSSMYRLDINEQKIKKALSPTATEPANIAVAKLILDRQKQRVYTKHYYKQHPIEGLDEELKF